MKIDILDCLSTGTVPVDRQKIPLVIATDMRTFDAADTPDEVIEALEREILTDDQLVTIRARDLNHVLNCIVAGMELEDDVYERLEAACDIDDVQNLSTTSCGVPSRFYLLGNSIMLLPTPLAAGTLVVAYPFRPNQLVDAATCAQITAVSGTSVTVSSAPAGFVSGMAYDIVDHTSGNGIIAYDQTGTVSGNLVSFSALPSTVAVGNWLCLQTRHPFPCSPKKATGSY